ncbi:YegP family protein [Flavobacterium sp. NRK F10]|uniref:YegP family protein n=1 Tax=Flavobacterium sp. NRK F10 TaxID=2954931 RepID=UPI002091A533|nr:YegP family protein [Flavobacterium sp. NRK F10]MCO6175208.1 YegP family protein [Flavobacterium sp. NRK F10]
MATFIITKRPSGFYKYELTSRKGKTIFTSNPFELRFECEEEIEHIKQHIDRIFFMNFRSGSGKYFFKLILDEKEIAVSRKYTTQLLMEKGVNEIKKYMETAEILDFSASIDIFGAIEEEKK